MSIEVISPGLLTTVQDAGRFGHRMLGVGPAGTIDPYSRIVANMLVGNPADHAVLEITLQGPTLRFHRAARIAICGAPIDADSAGCEIPGWRPIDLPAGSELRLGHCRKGCRATFAVAGGIDVAQVLGSRSTDLRGGFGGVQGRALRAGDRFPLAMDSNETSLAIPSWWIDPAPDLEFPGEVTLRLLPGRDAVAGGEAWMSEPFRVSPASNRQGLRLQGATFKAEDARDRISEPVAPGTVQLPPDGQPIVLLADAQTVGGYPRVGHVAAVDLPRLAQLRPGESLRFEPVAPAVAHQLACQQRQRLARIALAIEQRLGH